MLAFRGWTVFSDVGPGHEIPFYLLPTLGGQNTLRAYHNYEFHDQNLLVVNAESRWAIFTHVDAALFFDAGNVAAAYRDLNLDKTSGRRRAQTAHRAHDDRTTGRRPRAAGMERRVQDERSASSYARPTGALPTFHSPLETEQDVTRPRLVLGTLSAIVAIQVATWTAVRPSAAGKAAPMTAFWQAPGDLGARDLFNGPWGAENAP